MKSTALLLAATLAVAALAATAPAWAQTAPTGWKTQIKTDGARAFTPPNLKAGEVYGITIYEATPLGGQSLEAYLRKFAGPVEGQSGQLLAPLKIGANAMQAASATGIYSAPNGAQLFAVFNAFSFDGGRSVAVSRVLTSSDTVFFRYKLAFETLIGAMGQRTRDEAGDDLVNVPARVLERLQPGGAIVPGIYAGEQFRGDKLQARLRLHLYPNGEYRFKNERDEGFGTGYNAPVSTGKVGYNPSTGQMDFNVSFDLVNGGATSPGNFCFYGHNSAGKTAIYGEYDLGFQTSRTSLVWVAAVSPNAAPSLVKAREDAARAEENRFKFVVAPGRGLKDAQIAAITQEYSFVFGGGGVQVRVLLRDGTIYDGLPPVALDQFDYLASRQKEPKLWGRWRAKGQGYEASWSGKPFEKLEGSKVVPAPVGLRLNDAFEGATATQYSHQFSTLSLSKTGRFSTSARGGIISGFGGAEGSVQATTTWDDGGVATTTSVAGGATAQGGTLSSSVTKKKNANGDREGTYAFNGYALTLRYDNGQIERVPTFFLEKDREYLWFDGLFLQAKSKD